MIYRNEDPMAVTAMEADRTGNYGDYGTYGEEQGDYGDYLGYDESNVCRCPVCGAVEPEYYYLDDDEECIGCTECIYRTDVLF